MQPSNVNNSTNNNEKSLRAIEELRKMLNGLNMRKTMHILRKNDKLRAVQFSHPMSNLNHQTQFNISFDSEPFEPVNH